MGSSHCMATAHLDLHEEDTTHKRSTAQDNAGCNANMLVRALKSHAMSVTHFNKSSGSHATHGISHAEKLLTSSGDCALVQLSWFSDPSEQKKKSTADITYAKNVCPAPISLQARNYLDLNEGRSGMSDAPQRAASTKVQYSLRRQNLLIEHIHVMLVESWAGVHFILCRTLRQWTTLQLCILLPMVYKLCLN